MEHSHSADHDAHRTSDENSGGGGHDAGHHSHHAHMVADFRRRFWVSLALTLPVLALAQMIQRALGVEEVLDFPE